MVRDLLRGKHRFGEFTASPEAIPTNILAERLRRLKAKGIIRARRYSGAPPRVEYFLTAKGEELRPILRAMVDWGVRHAGGRVPPGYVATPTAIVPAPSPRKPARRAAAGRLAHVVVHRLHLELDVGVVAAGLVPARRPAAHQPGCAEVAVGGKGSGPGDRGHGPAVGRGLSGGRRT